MANANSKILTAEQELKLRKPIDMSEKFRNRLTV